LSPTSDRIIPLSQHLPFTRLLPSRPLPPPLTTGTPADEWTCTSPILGPGVVGLGTEVATDIPAAERARSVRDRLLVADRSSGSQWDAVATEHRDRRQP